MKAKAFTLTEILVVVGIIVLLAGILLPVVISAKRNSTQAPCTAQLRQIYVASHLYYQDNDQRWPDAIASIASPSSLIYKCPADQFGGVNTIQTDKSKTQVSYFYLPASPEFRKVIATADPQHGLAYCVLHGNLHFDGAISDARAETSGLVLRLVIDGSIQKKNVGFFCTPPTPSGRSSGRPEWFLLSDSKCPEPFCPPDLSPCSAQG